MSVDLVAREEELSRIRAFLGGGHAAPASLVLSGEAGVGKSMLWSAGVSVAAELGLRVLVSRPAEAEQALAYAGLGDLLDPVLEDVLGRLQPPRRRALEAALLLDDHDERVDPRAVAVAVRSALSAVAATGPVVLAIDDVQWLDAASVSALAFALRRLGNQPTLVLLARRIGAGRELPELALGIESDRATQLSVQPLSVGATQQLLLSRLGQSFPRPVLLRIHEASGGNPFYALELAGAVGPEVDATQPLPVPRTLEELLAGRLAVLPGPTRAALLLLAASGHAPRDMLAAADVSEDILEPAFAGKVLERTAETIRFSHPLLAAVVYQSHTPPAQRRAHRLIAETERDPTARARHLAVSADGPDATIAGSVEEATAAALARGAPMLAAELAEHALRLTPPHADADRRRRLAGAVSAHLAAADVRRADTVARELVASAPAGQERAEALVLLSGVEVAAGDHAKAIVLRREALSEPDVSERLQAEIHRWLGSEVRMNEGLASAERHARTALELAERIGDDAFRAGTLAVLALLRFNAAHPDGVALAEEAYELAVAAGDPEQRLIAASALAHVLVWSVQPERARSLLLELYDELAERNELMSSEPLWYLSLVERRAGNLAAAVEYAERSLDIVLQYAVDLRDYSPNYALALAAAHVGDLDRAQELAALGPAHGTLGLIEFWRGNLNAALEHFATPFEASGGVNEPTMLFWAADHVEALLEADRVDEALAVLAEWEGHAKRVGRTWILAQVTRCRGLVAAARGEIERAQGLLEEAVDELERVADPFGRSRALLALGIVRRRARQKRAAREAIEAAVAGFEAIGAAGWAETARAELGRIGGRRREEGLSPAERRVAALVAEGRTNREVAAALFLGERTVESHLSRVYTKLGVRSRTELARRLPSAP
jgi:DNA-binding CsgD family transcriptional regulator